MKPTIAQTFMNEYASDIDATREKPDGNNYRLGVDVGYTAPAKWWNWLFFKITRALNGIKTDKESIRSELLNTISVADITPSASDTHQLSKAIDTIAFDTVTAYDEEEVTEEIQGQMVTHKKNQPFVVGHTLYIPDTELL